ncbi:hypothetical protein TGAM01_v201151 [Trichoderma gamsii]|uniref:Uncharacterized protein n=1 Tax=Trichoderma gamsii TaxID=398673 RepID=A0A2P4ZZR3_9HYPO|nr:hypothetical protein TGAM01_v201151 [Trichoderma gamsii]PON29785.1 hypothetical protein TGAM01_v201151 [Trichoderma gamsii]
MRHRACITSFWLGLIKNSGDNSKFISFHIVCFFKQLCTTIFYPNDPDPPNAGSMTSEHQKLNISNKLHEPKRYCSCLDFIKLLPGQHHMLCGLTIPCYCFSLSFMFVILSSSKRGFVLFFFCPFSFRNFATRQF